MNDNKNAIYNPLDYFIKTSLCRKHGLQKKKSYFTSI